MYYGGEMDAMYGVDNTVATVLAIYFMVIGVILIGALVNFVIRGFGMYKMGKAQGRTNSWLAFIPYARTYFQGELSGSIVFKNKTMKSPGIWMIVIPIVSEIIMAFMVFIFWIVIMVSAISSGYGEPNMGEITGIIGAVIVFALSAVLLSIAATSAIKVLTVLVDRQIYQEFTTTNMAILHAVLGVFIPFYESICMLIFGRRAEAEIEPQGTEQIEDTTIE